MNPTCYIAQSDILTVLATLPKTTYDEDTGRTTCSRKIRLPLQLERNFASASFGVLEPSVFLNSLPCAPCYSCTTPRSHVLLDPTAFEEPLMDIALTVIVDDRGQLISISESGDAISQETLLQCIGRAKERALQLQKLL